MTSLIKKEFTLQKDQNFTACSSSNSCKGGIKTTSKSRDGELEINLDSNSLPAIATFYYPNKEKCTDPLDQLRRCDLKATFVGKELQELINSSNELADYRTNNTDEEQRAHTQLNTDSPDRVENNRAPVSEKDANWLGSPYILLALAIPILIFIVYLRKKALNSVLSPPRISQKNSGNSQRTNLSYQQAASPSLTDDIRRQLSSFQLQLNQLNTKLDNLETEMIVIGQKVESVKPKVTQPLVPQSLPPAPFPIPKISRQLDVSLIKEAVATNDYGLIRNFAHDFVTETLDSRQGKEESARFSIDGDQNTYLQRAQSEFIAIACANETYLIPNILPNATDPCRTIKGHVDRNKAYQGAGQNLLSLSELATVKKSGDSYILAKSGRIN
jgi:hypothetical protein